jgi:uncharacterized protein YbaP (TraB family)
MPFPRCVALALAVVYPALACAAGAPVCDGRNLLENPAVRPDYAAFADDLVNDEGLLWKIEKEGTAPSYLYGSIHSTQDKPVEMAREAARYLDQAKAVVTELGGPIDAAMKAEMSVSMALAARTEDADSFVGEVPADETERVERYLAAHGVAKAIAHHLNLWFLAMATTLPKCEIEGEAAGLPEVDDTLARLGKSKGLPVVALETIDEQIAAVAATPPELAAQMIVASARSPEFDDDAYVTLLTLYQQKRPARAVAVIDAVPGISDEDRNAEREFTKQLLVGRNETMATRAAPRLAAGGAFISVGALHLTGKNGLIERFRAMGYSVTRIW